MNLSTLILHPFLIFLSPVLYVATAESGESIRLLFSPAFAGLEALELLAMTAAGLLLGRLLKDRTKAFVAVSAVCLLTNLLTALHSTFYARAMFFSGRVSAWNVRLPLPEAVLVAGLLLYILKYLKNTAGANRFLNIFSILLFSMSALSGGREYLLRGGAARAAAPAAETPVLRAGAVPPDVYHIILDGYTDAPSMSKYYGLDLAPFERGLEELGFRVVRNVAADYPSSEDSRASMLNMRYLPSGQRKEEVIRTLQDSAVSRAFKRAGYRYINITSGTLPQRNPYADSVPVYDRYPIHPLLLDLSPFMIFADGFRYRQALYSFEAFRSAARAAGPKFVVLDLPLPHPPYLVSADGTMSPREVREDFSWDNRAGYAGQVHFLNRELLRVLAEIKRTPSGSKAIILLQSDHGSRGAAATEAERTSRRFAVFCAVSLPGGSVPPPGTALVNFYRFIFDGYFGTRLGQLKRAPRRPAEEEGRGGAGL